MDNIDFVQEMLSSPHEYWVVAKATQYREYGSTKRGDDDILLITLPRSIDRETAIEDLPLKEVRELLDTKIDTNIPLSNGYAPFQYGYSLGNFYRGFPLDFDKFNEPKPTIKALLIRMFELESHSLDDYKKLLEEL